jgi:hypothetical protein
MFFGMGLRFSYLSDFLLNEENGCHLDGRKTQGIEHPEHGIG